MLCLGPVEGKVVANEQDLSVYFIQSEGKTFKSSESNALKSNKRVTLS